MSTAAWSPTTRVWRFYTEIGLGGGANSGGKSPWNLFSTQVRRASTPSSIFSLAISLPLLKSQSFLQDHEILSMVTVRKRNTLIIQPELHNVPPPTPCESSCRALIGFHLKCHQPHLRLKTTAPLLHHPPFFRTSEADRQSHSSISHRTSLRSHCRRRLIFFLRPVLLSLPSNSLV